MTAAGRLDELPGDSPFPGVERHVLTTEKATVQEYRFGPGASFPQHRHPQEQITVVLEGSLTFTAGGEAQALEAGAWSVVAGGTAHGITAGPAGARFLAVLVPPRAVDETYVLIAEPDPQEPS
jgi:quercetin dioxygenase-like cupin family protein